ncbi:unnamed protein product [Ectocarpus sp. 12 AP-2014]
MFCQTSTTETAGPGHCSGDYMIWASILRAKPVSSLASTNCEYSGCRCCRCWFFPWKRRHRGLPRINHGGACVCLWVWVSYQTQYASTQAIARAKRNVAFVFFVSFLPTVLSSRGPCQT